MILNVIIDSSRFIQQILRQAIKRLFLGII